MIDVVPPKMLEFSPIDLAGFIGRDKPGVRYDVKQPVVDYERVRRGLLEEKAADLEYPVNRITPYTETNRLKSYKTGNSAPYTGVQNYMLN